METLNQEQIAALNTWISAQFGSVPLFYQSLAEISMAYARMYLTLSEVNAADEARHIGDRKDLYILSELMNIFKTE